ncbi:rab11 family-interacting protein 3 isoform X2 [Hemicordylus capensis]|uniref:rab11 family-interacting protein 3 isoform X2 n=1 Tax=Hemicordylus capensis TaxID=884348 RepID=UPI002304214F|nr:rab11 family-interacting protein 3 isoform X2 [Hemicordylus capensis]
MKMEPELLRTLSDHPGAKPDRLALGHLAGTFLLLDPQRGPLANTDLVLLARESPAGGAPLILRGGAGEKAPLAPEPVLNGIHLAEGDPPPQPFLAPEELTRRRELGLVVDPQPSGPISSEESHSGAGDLPDCPGEGWDLRLDPVRDGMAVERSAGAEEEARGDPLDPTGGLALRDLQLAAVEEIPEEAGDAETREALAAERHLLFGMEPSQEETNGLLFDAPWTKDRDGSGPQGDSLARPSDGRLAVGGPPGRTGVDLFPAFHPASDLSPRVEFGEAEHLVVVEEESPPSPEGSPRLRAVFDALDRDGDGFVRIEEFIQFATVYGAEQVKDLTRFLDPAGLGVISFEDFYRGISAIRNGADPDGQLCPMDYPHDEPPSTCPDEFDDFVTFEANEVTDSAYMGSESTYSECETFTDEDTSTLVHHEMHDDVETDSAIDSTVHSEFTDPIEEPENGSHPHDLPLTSDLNNHSIVAIISGEEHFEDYGEGNEADLFSDSLCNGESGFSSSSFLSPSPNKRLSSKKVARHLHQTGTLAADAMEEPYHNNVDCLEEDIADKVIFLEKRVTELEKDTAANGEQHSRLKQENLQLVHRANALEEQLKEQELKADELLMEEIRKQRELLSKMEREKSIEIENLQARLQQLDEENGELRSCVPCLKANIERLEEEKRKLLDEIEDLTAQLTEEQESKRKLGDKLSHERHNFQKDKESTQELIEDLRKQLEHLQLFKLEAEQRRGRSSSIGLQEYNSRTRETELEHEIRRLKQDNRTLKEQNDELNGQIINLSIQGAKNLFSASFSESLAAEISSVSRDELMEAIQKQEEINFRLQDYIDRIIVAIMETNPSILEVK